jgi:murein DD-endopeptidase MepM/ murein hydrolase activator NlpD
MRKLLAGGICGAALLAALCVAGSGVAHAQELRRGSQGDAAPAQPAPPSARPSAAAVPLSAPRLHVAQPGDTMETIAARYGFEVVTLERMNGLVRPYQVRPGDLIVLPNPAVLVREAERYRPSPSGSSTTQPASAAPPPPPRAVLASRTTPPAYTPPARRHAGPAFYQRPVSGPIVAGFGMLANGQRLDGVEMAAQPGTPILAAAEGVVVYAGGDLPAYGNLVLVRHPDGGVTAYGYAGTLNVREGARVMRGDALGAAGERGRIFFQVRRGSAAIDPAPLIGG